MSQALPRSGPSFRFTTVVCGLASYLDAAGLVATGLGLVLYQSALGITAGQLGILTALLTLFVGLGSVVGGRLGDRLGRRRVFTVTMVLVIAGALLLAFGGTFPLIVIGIVVLGAGIGADLPVSLATISEAASETNRGAAVVFSHVLWTAGILVTLAISASVGGLGLLAGQILFGHVAVIAAIVLVLRLMIPESALWLEARRERSESAPSGSPAAPATKSQVRDLTRAPYVVPFLVLAITYALLAIGAGTIGGFGAFIAVNLAGVTVQTFSVILLAISVVAIAATLWFARIVDTKWRMTFFAVGAVMMVVGYTVVAIFGFNLTTLVIGIALSNLGMCFAFESILKVWMQEVFPTMLRSTAQGTVMALARFVPVLVQAVTPALLLANGRLFYAVLAVVTLASVTALWITFRKRTSNEFAPEHDVLPLMTTKTTLKA